MDFNMGTQQTFIDQLQVGRNYCIGRNLFKYYRRKGLVIQYRYKQGQFVPVARFRVKTVSEPKIKVRTL